MSANLGDERPEHAADERAAANTGSEQRAAMARREVLKALGATSGILAVHALMPREWCGPVVELTRLPAHAATSATCTVATLTATRTDEGVLVTWTGATGPVDIYRKATGESEGKLVGILDADINKLLDVTADPKVDYEYSFQGKCPAKATVGGTP